MAKCSACNGKPNVIPVNFRVPFDAYDPDNEGLDKYRGATYCPHCNSTGEEPEAPAALCRCGHYHAFKETANGLAPWQFCSEFGVGLDDCGCMTFRPV